MNSAIEDGLKSENAVGLVIGADGATKKSDASAGNGYSAAVSSRGTPVWSWSFCFAAALRLPAQHIKSLVSVTQSIWVVLEPGPPL